MKFLDSYQEQSYALLRIVTGFLFLWHGTQKLFGFPTEFTWPMNPMMYAAGGIETLGGILVMIGLFTRPTAFICSGMMATAYWMAHGTKGFFPLLNGGELAVFYCFAFLYIATRGTGVWGIGKD
ncbi:MAG: putative oxidoreductase [Cryomorphaceae bacterium]|jgi:putative oxidoreductase